MTSKNSATSNEAKSISSKPDVSLAPSSETLTSCSVTGQSTVASTTSSVSVPVAAAKPTPTPPSPAKVIKPAPSPLKSIPSCSEEASTQKVDNKTEVSFSINQTIQEGDNDDTLREVNSLDTELTEKTLDEDDKPCQFSAEKNKRKSTAGSSSNCTLRKSSEQASYLKPILPTQQHQAANRSRCQKPHAGAQTPHQGANANQFHNQKQTTQLHQPHNQQHRKTEGQHPTQSDTQQCRKQQMQHQQPNEQDTFQQNLCQPLPYQQQHQQQPYQQQQYQQAQPLYQQAQYPQQWVHSPNPQEYHYVHMSHPPSQPNYIYLPPPSSQPNLSTAVPPPQMVHIHLPPIPVGDRAADTEGKPRRLRVLVEVTVDHV